MSADEVIQSNKSMADTIIVNLECTFGADAAYPVTRHLLAAREAMASLRDCDHREPDVEMAILDREGR